MGADATPPGSAVDVVHWNPTYRIFEGRIGRRIPISRPVNNFGDLLGPVIVDGMIRRWKRDPSRATRSAQLLSVGSVLHLAHEGAFVWGTGVNGKIAPDEHRVAHLDIRAVRGPRTREFLRERGHTVPAVFGDPGLLLGHVRPDLLGLAATRQRLVVNNFRDAVPLRFRRWSVSPQAGLEKCLTAIARSELVVGSSLHGVVVAEALGIPARAVLSSVEPSFKYDDYYRATGRPDWTAATSIGEALAWGGESPPVWDPDPLIAAFPYELWAPTAA